MNDCRHKRPAKCTGNGFVFRKVVIPASLGDDITGQDKPENGAYTNSYVEYEANGAQYMYDSGGIYTKIEGGGGKGVSDFNELENRPKYAGEEMTGDTDIPDFSEDIAGEVNARIAGDNELRDDIAAEADARTAADSSLSGQIANKQDKLTGVQLDAVNSGIDNTKVAQIATNTGNIADEILAREGADNDLQGQIDALSAASDVTDIVGTYAALQAYDTSKLKDNDIIKVLQDETHDDETTYYRWSTSTETFSLIGEEGPYYTKSAADAKFQDKLSAGTGIDITNDVVSADTSILATKTDLADKQDKLTAGANITIDANGEISATDTTYTAGTNIQIDGTTISATDTTYSNFTGTDGVDAGTAGLVPAPATTDAGKYLKADGTWGTVSGGIPTNATFWGQSYNSVNNKVDGSIILNENASGSADYSVTARNSLGRIAGIYMSRADVNIQANTSAGIIVRYWFKYDYATFPTPLYMSNTTSGTGGRMQIKKLGDPTDTYDAATKNYVDTAVAGAGATVLTPVEYTNLWENA